MYYICIEKIIIIFDNNIWLKTCDTLRHIDDLSSESKNYVLEKLKQESIC